PYSIVSKKTPRRLKFSERLPSGFSQRLRRRFALDAACRSAAATHDRTRLPAGFLALLRFLLLLVAPKRFLHQLVPQRRRAVSDSQVRNARFHGFAHHLLLRPLPVLVSQAVKPKLLPVFVNHAPQLVQLPIQLIVHGHLTKLLNLRRKRLSHTRDLRTKLRLRPVGGHRSAGAQRPARLCHRLLIGRLKRSKRRRIALKQLLQLEHRLHLLKSLLQLSLSLSKPLRLAGVVRLTQVALAPLLKLRQTELLPANLNQRVFAALVLGRLAVLRVGGSLLFAFWLILSRVLRVIQA